MDNNIYIEVLKEKIGTLMHENLILQTMLVTERDNVEALVKELDALKKELEKNKDKE